MTNRQIIYDLISKSEKPLTIPEIYDKTGIRSDYADKCLLDLWRENQIKKELIIFTGWVATHDEVKK